eukprot:jgi/Picre1/32738/NNA_008083.t1
MLPSTKDEAPRLERWHPDSVKGEASITVVAPQAPNCTIVSYTVNPSKVSTGSSLIGRKLLQNSVTIQQPGVTVLTGLQDQQKYDLTVVGNCQDGTKTPEGHLSVDYSYPSPPPPPPPAPSPPPPPAPSPPPSPAPAPTAPIQIQLGSSGRFTVAINQWMGGSEMDLLDYNIKITDTGTGCTSLLTCGDSLSGCGISGLVLGGTIFVPVQEDPLQLLRRFFSRTPTSIHH